MALTVSFALVLGACALTSGCRSEERNEWIYYSHDLRATNVSPLSSEPVQQPYLLWESSFLQPVPIPFLPVTYFACDLDGSGVPAIITAEDSGGTSRVEPQVIMWEAPDFALATPLAPGHLLTPFRDSRTDELKLLCWRAEYRYEQVPDAGTADRGRLFVRSYQKEGHVDQSTCLLNAARAAARGESLRVSKWLEVRGLSDTTAARIPLRGARNPQKATVGALRGVTTALVSFNSGYQVSKVLYRALLQPRVDNLSLHLPSVSEERHGSFRGLLAVDLERGVTLWEHRLGAYVNWPVVFDINEDGLEEIIIGTYSPTNVVSGGGTTDYGCSYVLCFDAFGNELWRYRFPGWYISVSPAISDVVGGSEVEVVAVLGSGADRSREVGQIVVLSGTGDVLSRSSCHGGTRGLVVGDFVGDGKCEIVTGGTGGKLLMLDGNLDVVASLQDTAHVGYENRFLTPVAANDIDGDGTTEVIALSAGWSVLEWQPLQRPSDVDCDPLAYLVVAGERLEEECRLLLPAERNGERGIRIGASRGNWLVVDVDGDGRVEVLFGRGRRGSSVFEIVSEGD
jgi:hypothetical protein